MGRVPVRVFDARKALLRRMHGAAAKCGVDHEKLHLIAAQRFGVDSVANLTNPQMNDLIRAFETARPYRKPKGRPDDPATKAQLKYIADLRLGARLGDDAAFRAWLVRSLKIWTPPDHINRRDAKKILDALIDMNNRKGDLI